MLTVAAIPAHAIPSLLDRYALNFAVLAKDMPIRGSFWGGCEAGIVGQTVYAREDTPVHSVLHESGHIICMTGKRRERLFGDAGSDDLEEAAVCYLQVLLADELPGAGRVRIMRDMDAWGYSFRLGSTADWFYNDAQDVSQWLETQRLVDAEGHLTYRLRE